MTVTQEATPLFKDSTYKRLNDVVRLGLPGLGTLYFTIASIWGLPYGDEVVGTCAALALFGGVLLKISQSQYKQTVADKDGSISIMPDDGAGAELTGVKLDLTAEELANKNMVVLKVVSQ